MIANVFGLRLIREPRVRRDALLLLFAVVLLFRGIQFVSMVLDPKWGFDFGAYWAAAGNLLNGDPIYTPEQLSGPYSPQGWGLYLYPPLLAVTVVPIAALVPTDYHLAAWVWAALGLLILVWSVLTVARVERLDRRFPVLRGRGRWLLVGAALAMPPTIGELAVGSVHLELLGLFTIAWLGLRREDAVGERWAGIAVGVAVLVKVFPVILVVFFLATRRWTAARWSILGAAVAAAATLPMTGIGPWLDYPRVLLNLSAVDWPAGALGPTTWLTPLLGFGISRLLVAAACVVLVIWSARTRPAIVGFGVAVIGSILVAPAAYQHYLSILVLPFLLGLAAGAPVRILAVAYLLTWPGVQEALGDWASLVSRGAHTLAPLVLLWGLLGPGRKLVPEGHPSTPAAR